MNLKVCYHRIACKLIGFTKTDATSQKIIWQICGAVLFETCYLISLSIAPYSNFKFLFFAVLGLIVGGTGKERIESNRNRKRVLQLRSDFPYFVENLALCITAGLSPAMAINAILENEFSNSEQKILLIELKKLLSEINEGKSVSLALDGLAKRINLPEIYRFVDVLIVTMERGTPLAEILRQQAFDLREVQRRAFLDLGSKAEVKMLVPVVFLILPVSILFALWPSLYQLNQMSSF